LAFGEFQTLLPFADSRQLRCVPPRNQENIVQFKIVRQGRPFLFRIKTRSSLCSTGFSVQGNPVTSFAPFQLEKERKSAEIHRAKVAVVVRTICLACVINFPPPVHSTRHRWRPNFLISSPRVRSGARRRRRLSYALVLSGLTRVALEITWHKLALTRVESVSEIFIGGYRVLAVYGKCRARRSRLGFTILRVIDCRCIRNRGPTYPASN
jgi:hypothetical protein